MLDAAIFLLGILLLVVAVMFYTRVSLFPDVYRAKVVSSRCVAGADCRHSIQFLAKKAAGGGTMRADVYLGLARGSAPRSINVRANERSVVVDYPALYSLYFIGLVGMAGFLLTTVGLVRLISENAVVLVSA